MGIGSYLWFYNEQRHQASGYRIPAEVYRTTDISKQAGLSHREPPTPVQLMGSTSKDMGDNRTKHMGG